MRLISLNTWGGQIRDELDEFVARHRDKTDIFCFQEVFHRATPRPKLGPVNGNLYDQLIELLPDFQTFFADSQINDEGLALFVRPSVQVSTEGSVFIHRWRDAMVGDDGRTMGRIIQYATIQVDGSTYTIINFHGIWTGGGKGDTPERLEQSRKVREFYDAAPGKRILIGDFNLEPTTESFAILAQGQRDLIKEYGITSTRSHYYTKPIKFADYAIVSPDVDVQHFAVLQDPVSDHLPLLVAFT